MRHRLLLLRRLLSRRNRPLRFCPWDRGMKLTTDSPRDLVAAVARAGRSQPLCICQYRITPAIRSARSIGRLPLCTATHLNKHPYQLLILLASPLFLLRGFSTLSVKQLVLFLAAEARMRNWLTRSMNGRIQMNLSSRTQYTSNRLLPNCRGMLPLFESVQAIAVQAFKRLRNALPACA